MPFAVIAKFTAKSGMEEPLKAVLQALITPTRAEQGCLQYELLQSQSDPRQFTFCEKWTDEEAFAAHGQSPHVRRAREERAGLIDGAGEVGRWDVVA